MGTIDGSDISRPSALHRVMVSLLLLLLAILLFALQCLSSHVRQTKKRNKAARQKLFARLGLDGKISPKRTIIGFFHPYCNAGGGGERVLWQAIEYHLRQDNDTVVVVYSGDVDDSTELFNRPEKDLGNNAKALDLHDGTMSASKEEILAKCKARFDIALDQQKYSSRIWILPLKNRRLISDTNWKHFTLLGQSYGGAYLAFEACSQLLPDIWIDTMGHAFTFPIVKLFDRRIAVGGYVHYPVISSDMLRRVKNREAGHTNQSNVSKSLIRSNLKLLYYKTFAFFYALALRRSDALVANGSWTQNHLNLLIFGADRRKDVQKQKAVQVVYPPCDTDSLSNFPISSRDAYSIVSLAQFRPEKEHRTQIEIIAKLIKTRRDNGQPFKDILLCCIGSCRNQKDEERIRDLQLLVKEFDIERHVSFLVNATYSEVLKRLSNASIGLSTMIDEHFGINVVEFMAAGLITLSHASAGPLLDIAVPSNSGQITGFHAKTVDEFVDQIQRILSTNKQQEIAIRQAARDRAVLVFSNEAFCQSWNDHLWSRLMLASECFIRKSQ